MSNAHTEFNREQELAKKGIQLGSWPHQFTKSGNRKQTGEDQGFKPDGEHALKLYSEEYYCIHCKQSYWSRQQTPPPPPCPARNKKREMKRILG